MKDSAGRQIGQPSSAISNAFCAGEQEGRRQRGDGRGWGGGGEQREERRPAGGN